jgi:methionyl aminopeptidase
MLRLPAPVAKAFGMQTVADKAGFKVVRDFIGHGVGTVFHSAPNVFHFRNNEPGVMVKNMTFTIEPMLVDGNMRYSMWPDDWTVVTKDGSLSAQYEHTLLITEEGAEILTLP